MILKPEKIVKEWTDYNGHLNVAFYVHVFDVAADIMLDNFKMGGHSAKQDKKTTFVAEMYTAYKQEVRLGEEVETHLTYVDHDKKRLIYKMEMIYWFLLSVEHTVRFYLLYVRNANSLCKHHLKRLD